MCEYDWLKNRTKTLFYPNAKTTNTDCNELFWLNLSDDIE
jgi:hypothetical protein